MSNKLYVGNIPFSINQGDLNDLFGAHGAVSEVNIIEDRETGRPRGFAFVTMATADEAERAARELDGQEFQGRKLTVNAAQERTSAPRGDYAPRGGGGGGGYGQRSGGGGNGGNRRGNSGGRW